RLTATGTSSSRRTDSCASSCRRAPPTGSRASSSRARARMRFCPPSRSPCRRPCSSRTPRPASAGTRSTARRSPTPPIGSRRRATRTPARDVSRVGFLVRAQRLHQEARVETIEVELRDPVPPRVGLSLRPCGELLSGREPLRALERRRLLGDEELALDPVHASRVPAQELGLHLRGRAGGHHLADGAPRVRAVV